MKMTAKKPEKNSVRRRRVKKEEMISGQSWLKSGGMNVFQEIKAKRAAAEAAGTRIINLAIGQPNGPAFESARYAASLAIQSYAESMHEYQDNSLPGCPEFMSEFALYHIRKKKLAKHVELLPLPGIKSALALVIMACGAGDKKMLREDGQLRVATMTEPGYPTPADQCAYLERAGVKHIPLKLKVEYGFLPTLKDLQRAFPKGCRGLLMLNIPGNPGGQIATKEWMRMVCKFCAERGIRIFNDGAYVALDHSKKNSTLTDVAMTIAELEFFEAFSASKLIGNGTGWRIALGVGSKAFVNDIKIIKGNADSGMNAALAAGVLDTIRNDKDSISKRRLTYRRRITLLVKILTLAGMRLAVSPEAGFFTLWLVPNRAFGRNIKNAKHFNNLMIKYTGIVGVPFGKYIRYAVCATEIKDFKKEIAAGFQAADVLYAG